MFVTNLWSDAGRKALAWLKGRGLQDTTIQAAELGYNSEDLRQNASLWGLESEHKPIWVPRGIVIPWRIGGDLWRVNLRRPGGIPKYIGPAGYSNALYHADALIGGKRPVVLVEGEFDALILNRL